MQQALNQTAIAATLACVRWVWIRDIGHVVESHRSYDAMQTTVQHKLLSHQRCSITKQQRVLPLCNPGANGGGSPPPGMVFPLYGLNIG